MTSTDIHRAIDAVWRIESAKLIAGLTRIVKDVGLAEDLAQDALVAALERWPETGVPDNPGAWLMQTAKNRAIDQMRRRANFDRKQEQLGYEFEAQLGNAVPDLDAAIDDTIGDDLLRLVFIACHPILSMEGRVALTLRLLGGLTTDEIARAYLVPEATIAQRIVRAKRTLSDAKVPFEVPRAAEFEARLSSVLQVLYLVFNEGYSATAGDDWLRPALCEDAARLGRILAALVPQEAEVHGLLALMEIQASRSRARLGSGGEVVLLLDQDRALWDQMLIRRGLAALDRALEIGGSTGPYTIQAAIAACHARARTAAETAIARAVSYIHAGDIFQANISIRFSGQLAKGDTPLGLFQRLFARHPSPFATYLSLGDVAVVSHSPERFLSRTASGQLETRPIKGTMPRHIDPDVDAANARSLQSSVKDRAENLMIVDLMRNDLSRVCLAGSVKVPRLCALESFSTVHHLVSDVIGQQKPGLNFFDALTASFPPGSITGAPKVRAMEIIAELEGEPLGPWCGSMIRVGFDGSADSSVLIRTAACERVDDIWTITARAGAGIIADSEPNLEYDEMQVKASALRVAARNDGNGGL